MMSMKKICSKQLNIHDLKIGATEPLKLLIKKTMTIIDLAAYPQCWTIYRRLVYLLSNLCAIFANRFAIWTLVVKTTATTTITTTKYLTASDQCHQIAINAV